VNVAGFRHTDGEGQAEAAESFGQDGVAVGELARVGMVRVHRSPPVWKGESRMTALSAYSLMCRVRDG